MNTRHGLFWGLVIIGLLAAVGFFGQRLNHDETAPAPQALIPIATPTIFVHGWGSSYHAEEQMVKFAQTSGASNSVIRADVQPDGTVNLIGRIKRNAKNPIIEANLLNNKSISPNQSSSYVKAVVTALQKRYRFTQLNLVGHSMGNLQIAYYLRNNLGRPQMPKLHKQVSIAGHYNGYLGETAAPQKTVLKKNGAPVKMAASYRGLLSLRQKFPQTAQVLNIYGDTGHGSDGSVAVNSARSYRYLVVRARSYREQEFRGPNAQHSRLHNNQQVNRLLVNFLWSK